MNGAGEGVENRGTLLVLNTIAVAYLFGNATYGENGDGIVSRTDINKRDDGSNAEFCAPFAVDMTGDHTDDEITSHKSEDEEDTFLRADTLTNPVLNRQLQNILDDEHSDIHTRQLLLQLIRVVRHILNEGMPIRQLLELGLKIHQQGKQVNFELLQQWIKRLRLTQMCQLEGECLILLFGFQAEDLPFVTDRQNKQTSQIVQELLEFTNTRSHDWYFSQDADSIFIHNSNSSAMFSHVRRSGRYFRYYPSEGLTNFFASFVHSLSHIEE